MFRYQLAVAGLIVSQVAGATAQSTDEPDDDTPTITDSTEYRAPQGFGGYAWKTPLGKIARLAPDPVYVRVANSAGKITFFDFSCYQAIAGEGLPWDLANTLAMRACRETDGSGYHALAEYYVDGQGFRVTDEKKRKVVIFPITYQFCSQWTGFSYELKGDPLEEMKLCGARFYFQSETAAQAATITDPDHRTSYERILNWLIKNHGEPEGFDRQSWVYIPLWNLDPPRAKKAFDERHRNWQWCQPRGDKLVPDCEASIVLNYNPETGHGQVLYSTGPVWAYAHARQYGGSDGDPLYRVLHGGFTQPKVQHQCMDSFLCRPPKPGAMPEKMLARFRLPDKKE